MAFDPNNANLAIWLREEPTDPAATKQFTRGGGFKGTATNATYTVKRLTAAFGPVGWGWGYRVISSDDVFPPDSRGFNFVHIEFWYYPFGRTDMAEQRIARFEQIGGTEFAGRADDDIRKKSLTDAIAKAASHIGFCADVHLGLFDDNKYVQARGKQEAAESKALGAVAQASNPLIQMMAELGQLLDACVTRDNYSVLRMQAISLRPKLEAAGMSDEVDDLKQKLDAAVARIGSNATAKAA